MSKSPLPERDVACTETQARALLAASRDLLAIVSPSGHLLFVNENFTRVLGYLPEELLGRPVSWLNAPADVGPMREKFAALLASQEATARIRCNLRTKSGQYRWFDAEAVNCVSDPDIPGLLISYQDVTEIQRMEAQRLVLSDIVHALNQTSNLDELLHQIHHALKKVVYAENFFVALHDPQTEMFHFPFFVDQFDPPPLPQKVARSCMTYVFRTAQSCMIPQSEFDRLAAEGEVELVGSASPAWLGVPLKTPNATIGVMVVQHYQDENAYDQRDLEFLDSVGGHIALAIDRVRAEEALRKSESIFRLLFSHTPLPMWVFDLDTLRILQVNDAAIQQYGYSETEFRALTARDLRADGEEPAFAGNAEEWKQEARHHGHWRHRRKDGKTFEVDVVSHRIEYAGRSVRLVVAQDVSERQLLEQQLRQAQKMEAIGRLAGGVAHDFNNLLMVIKGHTELLLDALPNGDVARKIEQIDRSADRATALTRQLLAFSRMQMLQPRAVNLNSVVEEMSKLLPRLIGEDIDLIVRPSEDLGTIRADASQMEQVIMNLAVNARDAMPQGGKLIIETQNIDLDSYYREAHPIVQPGRYVLLAVSDTGVGMDAETQAHIFEPFFTTKEQGKGTGLGLATVYGVVKQSGGFVWLYSELGKGTTFKIYLPRVDEAAREAVGVQAPAQVLRGTETVLLTEDEQDVREVAREFLVSAGYQVLQAHSGEAAVEAASAYEGAIDVLVTDMVMPGMSGRELARRMRATRQGIRVIYMSGYSEHAAGEAAKGEAFAVVLTKPFSRSALLRTVREVLQKQ